MNIGNTIGRFTVKAIRKLEEYKSTGYLFVERDSGAEILHIHNDDEENVFGFNFSTVPNSSNGVAHILEHCVLSGSAKYPVRDPFFLIHGASMSTFMNAMTYPDKTIYPAASPLQKDFFNIMAVYADAVFFPLLRREHFAQEGHRLGVNEKGEPEISGVVYNEMKAHYSTQEAIEGSACYRSLYSDVFYRYDGGGDPAEIPNLSYEEFREFHAMYYHPSNCSIYLYGNISSEEYLQFLDDRVFSQFDPDVLRKRSKAQVPVQPAWGEQRNFEYSYPVSSEQFASASASLNLNWLLSEPIHPKTTLARNILSDLLVGSPASPLQKAILESDLGEDLSSSTGIENDLRQPVFTVGIRGTTREKSQDIEALILGALESLCTKGIDADLIEASIRRFEFRGRELKGGTPFGLRLLFKTAHRWLYGEDPFELIQFSPLLNEIKKDIQTDPQYFTAMIQNDLLGNPHRSRVCTYPDPDQDTREAKEEQGRIQNFVSERSGKPNALDQLKQETIAFQQFQQESDSEEDIAKLPFLSVSDIPRSVRRIDYTKQELSSGTEPSAAKGSLHTYPFFTNGISYVDLSFNISNMPAELYLVLPLLFHILPQMGTHKRSYSEMTIQWGLKTGGFSIAVNNETNCEGQNIVSALLRVKAVDEHIAEGLALVSELLNTADFSNSNYVWELFNEYRNNFQASIIPAGTRFAALRAQRGINPQSENTEDSMHGIIQGNFIEAIYARGKSVQGALTEVLGLAMKIVFFMGNLNISIVSDSNQIPIVQKHINEELKGLIGAQRSESSAQAKANGASNEPRAKEAKASDSNKSRSKEMDRFTKRVSELYSDRGNLGAVLNMDQNPQAQVEGIQYSTKVNFTALAIAGSHIQEKEQIHEQLLSRIINTGLLHEKIRMEGGAYGAMSLSDPLGRVFLFGSYRDPFIAQSWKAYAEVLALCAQTPPDQRSLDNAKISIAGKELHPLSPAEKAMLSLRRIQCGISDELREQRLNWLIESTAQDIQAAAQRLHASVNNAYKTVLASPDALTELAKEFPELKQTSFGS